MSKLMPNGAIAVNKRDAVKGFFTGTWTRFWTTTGTLVSSGIAGGILVPSENVGGPMILASGLGFFLTVMGVILADCERGWHPGKSLAQHPDKNLIQALEDRRNALPRGSRAGWDTSRKDAVNAIEDAVRDRVRVAKAIDALYSQNEVALERLNKYYWKNPILVARDEQLADVLVTKQYQRALYAREAHRQAEKRLAEALVLGRKVLATGAELQEAVDNGADPEEFMGLLRSNTEQVAQLSAQEDSVLIGLRQMNATFELSNK